MRKTLLSLDVAFATELDYICKQHRKLTREMAIERLGSIGRIIRHGQFLTADHSKLMCAWTNCTKKFGINPNYCGVVACLERRQKAIDTRNSDERIKALDLGTSAAWPIEGIASLADTGVRVDELNLRRHPVITQHD